MTCRPTPCRSPTRNFPPRSHFWRRPPGYPWPWSPGSCKDFGFALVHDRRRILHVAVTPHPTSMWTRQQLREAFPWHVTSRFLLHDRDAIFDAAFRSTVATLGLAEVCTAPRSHGRIHSSNASSARSGVSASTTSSCSTSVTSSVSSATTSGTTIDRAHTWRSTRTRLSRGRSMPGMRSSNALLD